MDGDYVHKIDISLSFQEIYLEHTPIALQKWKKKRSYFDVHFQLHIAFVSEIEIEQENDYIFFLFFRI